MFNSFLHWWCHTFYYRIPCCAYPLWFFYEVRWVVRYPKPTLLFGSKVVSAVQNSPHTFSTRIHHTFLRSKLPRTAIRANIDSRGWCSPFQAILHLGLHPPTPWGHAGGLVWVESSKQSRGTRLNCVFCSFRGPYSTHCKSCEKTSFWTNFFALWRRTCLVMGGHRHGSHTMAGVGHNHSFPHMSNLSYPEDRISSRYRVPVSTDTG